MDALRARMTEAAVRVLDGLDGSQRVVMQLPFEAGGERERWFYTPTDHGGLALYDMTPQQQQTVHQLLTTGLSAGGYVTASSIMGLENVLDMLEGYRNPFPHLPRSRNPNGYQLTIFGDPRGSEAWGWRFGGHHVSLHYLVHSQGVSTLPTFFGANPAQSRGVGPQLLRPLGAEEDLGRELLHLLDADQRSRAVLSPHAPRDLITSNRARIAEGDRPLPGWMIVREPASEERKEASAASDARFTEALGFTAEDHVALEYTERAKGLPAAEMTDAQRDALTALLRQYIGRMPEEIAEAESARLASLPLAELAFAWAGSAERGAPHYYRVQGPGLLIEYDNTQNDANHIHSVWRDPQRDFGRDVLAEHYAQAHQG